MAKPVYTSQLNCDCQVRYTNEHSCTVTVRRDSRRGWVVTVAANGFVGLTQFRSTQAEAIETAHEIERGE